MRVHVLPGDAIAAEFRNAGFEGDTIIFRECLIVGPTEAEDNETFWDERAKFILSEYGEDEIAYHESVADEIERLRERGSGDEAFLWFEYELFCSVNLWFCLSILAGSGATVYRVGPPLVDKANRWNGFGDLDASGLQTCWTSRQLLGKDAIELGARLWHAYRRKDMAELRLAASVAGDVFPFVEEVCEAAAMIDEGPQELVRQIVSGGTTDLSDVFREFSSRGGVYGFGDLQVQRLLERL